jgi:hypothetical protein
MKQASENIRVRIGVKKPFGAMFPNALTSVVYMPKLQYLNVLNAIDTVKAFTPGTWTSKLFIEVASPE